MGCAAGMEKKHRESAAPEAYEVRGSAGRRETGGGSAFLLDGPGRDGLILRRLELEACGNRRSWEKQNVPKPGREKPDLEVLVFVCPTAT